VSRNRNRTRAIRALMAATGLKYTAAARALDEGRAKVAVDGREYTISPDGETAVGGDVAPVVRHWFEVSA